MKIGFANIYSFRPHVEHLYYLSNLLENDGHNTFFLTCDSSVPNCYTRLIKGTGKLQECSKCILGGVRSYSVKNITSISSKINSSELSDDVLDDIALSSSCTLNRTESELEWNEPDVVSIRSSLHEPVLTTYRSALKWISDNKLDAVICFNGRMEMTNAVTYACEQSGIPFVTHERTWFGDGLTLIPNANCLSINSLRKMVEDFDEKSLTGTQAQFSGRLIALRFLQQNTLEWRLFNKDAVSILWPEKSKGRKVLVLPSSKNEFAGHEEWKCDWQDNTAALDDFFEAFSVSPEDVVVRFHPIWAETIGKISGERAISHYTDWARRRGIHFISSEKKANTYDLIGQADIVVMNGGSSAVEAGACGKQVICLGASHYDKCGFVRAFVNKNDLYRTDALNDIDPEIVMRKTLRYVYVRAKRFPQYVDHVKAIETTKYEYVDGADPQRLLDMFATGKVLPDDDKFSDNESDEDAVISALEKRDWQLLANYVVPEQKATKSLLIQRRFGLRWLDGFRSMFARGDR